MSMHRPKQVWQAYESKPLGRSSQSCIWGAAKEKLRLYIQHSIFRGGDSQGM